MVRFVSIGRGQHALVDDKDYERVAALKWHLHTDKRSGNYYAMAHGDVRGLMMHRFILEVWDSAVQVDHKNHNGLDNQRDNLRIVTQSENSQNRKGARKDSKTGVRGVSKKPNGKYQVVVTLEYVRYHIGHYPSLEEAEQAAIKARKKLHKYGDGR